MVITTKTFCTHDFQFNMIMWRDGNEMEEYICSLCGAYAYMDAD